MFRFVVYVFLFVIFISLARGVIGIVGRAFSQAMRASAGGDAGSTASPTFPATGEFKKDPVCGTYISTATSLQQVTEGTTFYFCSPECRNQFKARS